jgi:hypothetical protein
MVLCASKGIVGEIHGGIINAEAITDTMDSDCALARQATQFDVVVGVSLAIDGNGVFAPALVATFSNGKAGHCKQYYGKDKRFK